MSNFNEPGAAMLSKSNAEARPPHPSRTHLKLHKGMIEPRAPTEDDSILVLSRESVLSKSQALPRKVTDKYISPFNNCPCRLFICTGTRVCRVFYSLLAFIGNILMFLFECLIGTITFLFFILCCCCVNDRRTPFRQAFRNQQIEKIDSSVEQQYMLCIELLEVCVRLKKTKPKKGKFTQLTIEYPSGSVKTYFVIIRPHVQDFLASASKYFKIAVYTSLSQELSIRIVRLFDKDYVVSSILSQDDLVFVRRIGFKLKDLTKLHDDMSKIIMIDINSDRVLQRQNVLPLLSLKGVKAIAEDKILLDLSIQLTAMFKDASLFPDVRDFIKTVELKHDQSSMI